MSLPIIPLAHFAVGELFDLEMIASDVGISDVTIPSETIAGDLMVFWEVTSHIGVPPATDPVGFENRFDQIAFSTGRKRASIRIATATDAGETLTAGMGAGQCILLVFRGNKPVSSVSAAFSVDTNATNGNPSPIEITSGSGTTALLVFAHYFTGFGGSVNPRTFNPAKDGEVDAAVNVWAAWKFFGKATEPVNVTIDMDDEGDANWLDGLYLELE